MNCSASSRLAASVRNDPRTAEVTVVAPGFFTPRIDMQKCSASITTIEPGAQFALHRLDDVGGHALLDL